MDANNNIHCQKYGICGGCTYGEISYQEELKLKENLIYDILAETIGIDLYKEIYQGIVPSPRPLEYRNKMEFSFGDECKGGALTLGMHKKRAFYDIVDASGCMLVDADVRKIVSETTAFFREKNVPYYHKRRNEGYLRHLLVRKATFTGQIMIDLVTTTSMPKELADEWTKRILKLDFEGELKGILHTVNDRVSDVVDNQGTRLIYGQDYIVERILGLEFKITPFSFFQTNSAGAEKLYEDITKLVPETGVIYDLYSGTGTIAQILSKYAENVVGVELVPEAVDAAKINAKFNNITNAEFICGDVLKTLDSIEKRPDMIVLDPPREGVVPKALDKILAYGVEQIIYVSCKATSLKRDLDKFFAAGYSPRYVKVVDMFPRTGNMETICLLSK